MFDEQTRIDISLSLKSWKEISPSYDAAIAFCREKSIELRSVIKDDDPFWGTEPLIPQADLYDLCIIMLNTARTLDGKLLSIKRGEKRTIIFTFQFDTSSCLDMFHKNLLDWIERAKFVNPLIDIDKTKTFSNMHKKSRKR